MDDSFVGEIRALPYTFVPAGWFLCQGQTLQINQFQVLYAVIGSTYGGDGQSTFKLPNLVGSVAIGVGQQVNTTPHPLAQTGGALSVPLTSATMPAHTHTFNGAVGASKFRITSAVSNDNAYLANFGYKGTAADPNFIAINGYVPATDPTSPVSLNPNSVGSFGGGMAHENRQPFINLCFCICYDGTYPSPA